MINLDNLEDDLREMVDDTGFVGRHWYQIWPELRYLAILRLARRNSDPELWQELSEREKFFLTTASDEKIERMTDSVIAEVADHLREVAAHHDST